MWGGGRKEGEVSWISMFTCGQLRSGSRCVLAVRRSAGKQKDLGSIRFGSPLSSKMVVYGHCLVTLPTQLKKH